MFDPEDVDGDPLAGMHDQLGRLAGEDRSGWSAAARSERVLGLLEVAERLQAEVLREVGDWDRVAAWSEDGALSPVAWLTARAPVTRAGAARLVRSARLVRHDERVGTALAAGRVSCAHVELIDRARRDRELVYTDRGEVLLDLAQQVNPQNFQAVARRWRNLADDLVATDEAYAQHLRRSLVFSGSSELPRAEFESDAEGFATFTQALEQYMTLDPPADPSPRRTLAQRRADALVEICAEVLARKQRVGRPVPNIDGTFDYPTLADDKLGDLSRPLCDITGVGPVARTVMERFCCGARLGRILMDGKSVILDQGRRTPSVTPEQRRALAHRDRGCVFPGCDRPPSWTDAHHVEFWVRDDGPTDLDNLVLLCRRHHVLCHEGRWTLTATPTAPSPPSGQPGGHRRHPAPPREIRPHRPH